MPNFTVGQIIDGYDTSKLPEGAIVVRLDGNTPHTRAGNTGYTFTDKSSYMGEFRVAYLPTPKPEPLFPIDFETKFSGSRVTVDKGYSSGDVAIRVGTTGDKILTHDEARKVAHALLAVIGEHPAKTVWNAGDEEPTTPGIKLRDKDGDVWHYLPGTGDGNWGFQYRGRGEPAPAKGTETWSYVATYGPLTLVTD